MIEFIGAKKTFVLGNEEWSLGPLDVKIKKEERVAIIGSSGSGKSTLLHLTGALTKLDAGQIKIFGKNLSTMHGSEMRKFRNEQIGFIFQDFFLFPEFSLIENVEMPMLVANIKKKTAQEKAKKILEEVGLSHRLNHHPAELSGGQRQRGAIARALVMEPDILLADEPTGNLDKDNSQKIIKLISELQKKRKMTLLLATHDDNVAEICSRKIILDNGQVSNDQIL